ncbi:heat-shock protein [Sorangium cellulosum]|uniref:Heat-shock protein n=1 Tax=Sorangium cellulosum TaxID=56 RepID=A0A4P2Q799_SORCE|nr:ATP-binding protein [Sorangium cellulosum]AUX25340.1 heat-shock protein [Sorangium cellulosum]
MSQISYGLFSELLLVRIHGRAEAYLQASGAARSAIVAACRSEATVPDLAQRILSRTIYAQASSRVGPLRELLQNALDASPPGARIDVRSSEDGREISVTDHGRGMTRTELLTDLLVPFRSGKAGEPDAIGEHGIGFFSALEIAPWIEVVTATATDGHRLLVAPLGAGPRYEDFSWTLLPLPRLPPPPAPALAGDGRARGPAPQRRNATGTSVRLSLAQRVSRPALAAEVAAAVGLVDPNVARIYVDGALVNTARGRLRRAAEVPIALSPSGEVLGALELLVGRGEGIEPQLTITQKGLTVATRIDPFPGPELGLHREIARAITAAGFGLVAELPIGVPLNKGRSAVAATAAAAVEAAIVAAFERFILRDALYDRELLRAVDHRLSSVLDRLVAAALLGESITIASAQRVDELDPAARTPTVAAPEQVIRFASGLLDAPLFRSIVVDAGGQRAHAGSAPPARPGQLQWRSVSLTLRELLEAHRAGVLRPLEGAPFQEARRTARWHPGAPHPAREAAFGREAPFARPGELVYLAIDEPLAQAFWRRLVTEGASAQPLAAAAAGAARASGAACPMPRTSREVLLKLAADVPGVRAVVAAMTVLERLDAAISEAADLPTSPIWVHQDLYGPDEMAHTDGSGISVNLASARVRALLTAVLVRDDAIAFSALIDLVLHEKTHVSLASYVPRPTAEHGTSFYRRKDWMRRRLLSALASGAVMDPMRWLAVARRGLGSAALPAPAELSRVLLSGAAAA